MPIGYATSLSLKKRVERGARAYARHYKTMYDLNFKITPGLSKSVNRRLVQPNVEMVLQQWAGAEPFILAVGAAIQPRRPARLTSAELHQDASFMALMTSIMVQWLVEKQVLWPASPDAVLSQTQEMSPALASWLRAHVDRRKKSGAKAASELASMVPDLINYLVAQGTISQGVVQGRITELETDEDAAQHQAVTVTRPKPWVQLPPEIECRRLMDTLAENLSGASQEHLFGSCLSLLGFVVFTARCGHLNGAGPV